MHASGVELVREVPLDALSSLALQPLAAFTPDAPTVPIYRLLFRRLAFPSALAPLRFRDVGPHLHLGHRPDYLVAVIALVRHYFFDAADMHRVLPVRRLFSKQSGHRDTRLQN